MSSIRPGALAVMVASVGAALGGCDISPDATIDFVNRTDEVVWVGHNPAAPEAFRVPDRLWIEVAPGEREVITDGGCIETGELVVATGPAESAVIDARPVVGADRVCAGDHWEWTGVGDHD